MLNKRISPKSRSQAAIDFLISWGWVIAIVIVVFAVVFWLGLFRTPTQQTLINGFQSLQVNSAGVNNTMAVFQLTNAVGQPITLGGLAVKFNGKTYSGLSCSTLKLSNDQSALCRVPVKINSSTYLISVSIQYAPSSGVPFFSNGTVSGASISGGIPLNNQSTYFVETNLPVGAVWAVTLGPVTKTATVSSSSGSTISISEPFGMYNYNISNSSLNNCAKLAPSPSKNSVSSSSTIRISYNGTCTTAFTGNGVLSGNTWSVTYNGVKQSTGSNSISFTNYVGNYSYSTTAPTVNSTAGCTTSYVASPSSGYALAGTSKTIIITHSTTCTTTFSESSLIGTPTWSVSYNSTVHTASAPSSITYVWNLPIAGTSYTVNSLTNRTGGCTTTQMPSPSSGSEAPGSSLTITFTHSTSCSTYFLQSGLLGQTAWTVVYNGTTMTTSATSPPYIRFGPWTLPFSGDSYSVNTLVNTTSACTTTQTPSPASGSASPGSNVSITFSPSTICTTTFIKPSPNVFNDLLNYSVTYGGVTEYPAYTNYTNLTFRTPAGSHAYTAAMIIRQVTSRSGTTYLNNCTIPVGSGAAAAAGATVNMSNLWVCGESWYTSGVPVGHFWNLTYGGVYKTSTSKYLNITTTGGGSLPLLSLTAYVLANSSNGCTTVYTPQSTSGEQPGVYGYNYIVYSPSTFCTATFNDSNEASSQHAWTVIYDGFTNSSTSTLVTFTLPLGNYSYSIQGWSGSGCLKSVYANQSTGWLTPGNTRVFTFLHLVSCGYTQTNFTESGLPKGYNWTVTYNSVKLYSTSNIISFNGDAGTFSYSVSSVTPTGCTNSYTPSPSSGSATAGTSNAITFSGSSTCTTTFTETGVSSGFSWTVTYNGTRQTESYPTSSMTFTTPFSSAPYTFYDFGGGCPMPGLLTGSPSYGKILVGSTQAISFSPSSASCI